MTRRGPFSADPWKASSWEIYVTKDCRTLGWGNGTPATPPCRSDGKVGHGPEGEGLQEAGFAKLAAACFGEFEEGGVHGGASGKPGGNWATSGAGVLMHVCDL